jgi:hypothetical protein
MNQQRMYGENGEPFLWSNRTRSIKFKYANTQGCMNNFIRNIDKTVLFTYYLFKY